jgi:predicted permease
MGRGKFTHSRWAILVLLGLLVLFVLAFIRFLWPNKENETRSPKANNQNSECVNFRVFLVGFFQAAYVSFSFCYTELISNRSETKMKQQPWEKANQKEKTEIKLWKIAKRQGQLFSFII